jgi:hypothetical protein
MEYGHPLGMSQGMGPGYGHWCCLVVEDFYMLHLFEIGFDQEKGIPDEFVVTHNERKSGMQIQIPAVGFLGQGIELGQETIDVIEECQFGFVKVLIVEGLFGCVISLGVCLVQELLILWIGIEYLIQEHIPNFLRDFSRVFVKEHSGMVVAHVFDFLGGIGKDDFAKCGGRGFVEESVAGKEMRWIGGISVGHSQG